MNKRIFCVLLVIPLLASGQPVAFDFESDASFPALCALESQRKAVSSRPHTSRIGKDDDRNSSVCFTEDVNRGGILIHSADPQSDPLGGSLSRLTVCMAFRANPTSERIIFLERLIGGTSATPGHFRFGASFRSGDDTERRGTFNLGGRDTEGQGFSAASTDQWIQQQDTWYWVGMVYDHGRVVFYLDGEKFGDEASAPMEELAGAGEVSYFIRAGYGFIGAFDDLFILPGKALSDEEMREAYKQGISSEEILRKIKE